MVTDIAQELARREADGIVVSLFWVPADDSLTVVCADTMTEERFTVGAEPTNALDVFHHPYAYAARQHVDYDPVTPALTEAVAV
jgi:hypothetical protein